MVQYTLLITASFFLYAIAEKEGKNYHSVLSWTPPLDAIDFESWDFTLSSVALKNKIVMVPNGGEQQGLMMNTWSFSASSWEVSIDFEVDYKSENAAFTSADWQIYFLSHVPESIPSQNYRDFG